MRDHEWRLTTCTRGSALGTVVHDLLEERSWIEHLTVRDLHGLDRDLLISESHGLLGHARDHRNARASRNRVESRGPRRRAVRRLDAGSSSFRV